MRPEVEKAVAALRSGQPDAMEQALRLLQNTVFSFSMKVCGHREDAEDTMQDVLTKATRYLPEITSPQALAVWLYTVAKNRCLMSRRRSKFVKETLSLDELMPDQGELQRLVADHPVAGPERAVLRRESGERVREAVRKVPPMYRLVLVLHDMEELSTADIARVLGLQEGTVRVRLHRARLFVRRELARNGTAKRKPRRTPARSARCRQMFAGLSDYLDGVMDDATCGELEKHMAGCKPCEAFLASLRATVQQVRRA